MAASMEGFSTIQAMILSHLMCFKDEMFYQRELNGLDKEYSTSGHK